MSSILVVCIHTYLVVVENISSYSTFEYRQIEPGQVTIAIQLTPIQVPGHHGHQLIPALVSVHARP